MKKAVQLIGGVIDMKNENQLKKYLAAFTGCMTDAGFEPNKLQSAVALNALYRSISNKNLMLVVPAGMGKTRISLATCIGLLMRLPSASKIVVVYLNEILKEQDSDPWEKMKAYMATNKRGEGVIVKRVVGWEQAISEKGPTTVYVIDEADKLFVDDSRPLPTPSKAVIAFTATVP